MRSSSSADSDLLKLRSEYLDRSRLLNESGDGRLQIQAHIGGGMACRRGDNKGGGGWLEIDTDKG
jgi:hypothetical protein